MKMTDLPEIKIVRHARATRLRLRIDPSQIRLTVPMFCTKGQIQHFLSESESWMIETWQKQQQKNIQLDRTLPIELKLFNLEIPLQVIYLTQKNNYIMDENKHQLLISDRQPEYYLKKFVIDYAQYHLPAYLDQVSTEIGLKFSRCSIRQPKTRWGSCSSKHDIMLNAGLVLFPKEITRYVCVHELAHTQHFNHSDLFWMEVYKHDQNYKAHQKILKNSAMPFWWSNA